MADTEQWKRRVEDWRRSGQSAAEYCKGQEFTAGMLYRWSSRLAQTSGSEAAHALPLVRLVRGPEPTAQTSAQSTSQAVAIVIEVHGVRVLVPLGADVVTVGVVLEALGAGGRSVAR